MEVVLRFTVKISYSEERSDEPPPPNSWEPLLLVWRTAFYCPYPELESNVKDVIGDKVRLSIKEGPLTQSYTYLMLLMRITMKEEPATHATLHRSNNTIEKCKKRGALRRLVLPMSSNHWWRRESLPSLPLTKIASHSIKLYNHLLRLLF